MSQKRNFFLSLPIIFLILAWNLPFILSDFLEFLFDDLIDLSHKFLSWLISKLLVP